MSNIGKNPWNSISKTNLWLKLRPIQNYELVVLIVIYLWHFMICLWLLCLCTPTYLPITYWKQKWTLIRWLVNFKARWNQSWELLSLSLSLSTRVTLGTQSKKMMTQFQVLKKHKPYLKVKGYFLPLTKKKGENLGEK